MKKFTRGYRANLTCRQREWVSSGQPIREDGCERSRTPALANQHCRGPGKLALQTGLQQARQCSSTSAAQHQHSPRPKHAADRTPEAVQTRRLRARSRRPAPCCPPVVQGGCIARQEADSSVRGRHWASRLADPEANTTPGPLGGSGALSGKHSCLQAAWVTEVKDWSAG